MELLANILRPQKLSAIIGQDHLIGKDKIMTNLVKSKKLFSMILYGRPGIGKTSLAYALVNELNIPYRLLDATINNKNDFEVVVAEAKLNGEMVVIMDEIHRLNRDKQDLLLPYIESGLIILIGLTTANPYHKINPAIRSRCHIFELKELMLTDIIKGLNKALKQLPKIEITKEALDYIAHLAGGDLRQALNLLEIAYYAFPNTKIGKAAILKINDQPTRYYDQGESDYYDLLSALQKSIRGSDVDASLHYLARLLIFGEIDSVLRRLVVIAYEDIGLANPGIGPKVIAVLQACELVGLPEAQIPLSVIVTEMALSPKSNSAYIAYEKALSDINQNQVGPVPGHLKNNSKQYKYPHLFPNNYVKQQYLPDIIKNKKYYVPGHNKYEQNLNDLDQQKKNS